MDQGSSWRRVPQRRSREDCLSRQGDPSSIHPLCKHGSLPLTQSGGEVLDTFDPMNIGLFEEVGFLEVLLV